MRQLSPCVGYQYYKITSVIGFSFECSRVCIFLYVDSSIGIKYEIILIFLIGLVLTNLSCEQMLSCQNNNW